ncbi:MAG: hypothetical protein DLM55_10015 [Acidimicrobiales bacterium]|nr:MAG: hypothetical protein DLM55_10015 [Acidimicrobiales bacterium]
MTGPQNDTESAMRAFAAPVFIDHPIDTPLEVIQRITSSPRRWFSRSRGVSVGSVARIPLFIAPSWLFAATVLLFGYVSHLRYRVPELNLPAAYLTAAAAVGLVFSSVLLHELAHAVVARWHGVGVEAVTLWMLGGYTEMSKEPATPRAEFQIAAAGPLTSALLCGVGAAGAWTSFTPSWLAELCGYFALTNAAIAIFNALPGLPLDGGAMVRAFMWRLWQDSARATIAAARAGQALAVFMLGFSFGLLYKDSGINTGVLVLVFVIPFFLWSAASHTVRRTRINQRLSRLTAAGLAKPAVVVASNISLANALKAAAEGGDARIVVHEAGSLTGIVVEAIVHATPLERHEHIPVGQLARTLPTHALLAGHATGPEVFRGINQHPDTTGYLVTHDGSSSASALLGVMSELDFAHAIEPPWQWSTVIRGLSWSLRPSGKQRNSGDTHR